MRRAKWNFENDLDRFRNSVTVALLLTSGILANLAMAQEKGQKTFSTPQEAAHALYTAAMMDDEKALHDILGAGGRQILHSGDEAEDEESRSTFVEGYEEMHRLVTEPDGTVTLYIGGKNWPPRIGGGREGILSRTSRIRAKGFQR
jgi:Protein of unknown function (DUF2950)